MTKLHRLLFCAALATAGTVLSVPLAAQFAIAPEDHPHGYANRPTQLAMTNLSDQIAARNQELDKSGSAAASGDTQPASAASSKKPNNNPSASRAGTRDKKKDKSKARPAPSKQEEEFDKVLRGIYG